MDVAKKFTFAEPESEVNDYSLLSTGEDKISVIKSSPFASIVLVNESSDKDDVVTDSMTSHTMASDYLEIKSSFLSDESLKTKQVQDITQDISILQPTTENIIESQCISSIPYPEISYKTDVTKDGVSDKNEP